MTYELMDLKNEIKKRIIKLKPNNHLSYHELVKSSFIEWAFKNDMIGIPEYRMDFYYKGRKIERWRKGKIDIVIKNKEGKIIYGIEIDRGLSNSSITKLNTLNPEKKVIISLSNSIERLKWKLPKDFILINIPTKIDLSYF